VEPPWNEIAQRRGRSSREEKVVGYLLSATHRYRANKARFFMQFGFRAEAWEQLAYALLDQARLGEVMRTRQTGFGPRYEIDGKLSCLSAVLVYVSHVYHGLAGLLDRVG
jgi:hypothetical protein